MTDPANKKKAGGGLQPTTGRGNHMGSGAAQEPTSSVALSIEQVHDQLKLDFTAPVPVGSYDGADQANENAEDRWRNWALREIAILAENGWDFTSDDVRQVVGEPDHPNRWGGVFLAARRAGLILPTGEVRPSTTPSRHGALVRVWRAA
ncbi:hypothetical protein PWY87_33975 [Kribbella solani]|uniref:hypothetical protein n=1 Tax=Kribbella solani TaxID=236067 RepID=UPI0029AF8E2E|nr:hypothetical protein [Kribbella solani]MDX3006725.1 hypothetical protein [Kribbella solani]